MIYGIYQNAAAAFHNGSIVLTMKAGLSVSLFGAQ